MLCGYPNAFYDSASVECWDEVYMQDYVKGLLDELSQIMPDFSSYRFYFLHATEDILPNGLADPFEKKILIQTGDQLGNEPAAEVMNAFYYVFKTHLRYQTGKYKNLSPYPLGLPSKTPLFPIKLVSERKCDVFYSGNLNKNRLSFYAAINKYERNIIKRLAGCLLISLAALLSKSEKQRNNALRIKSLIFRLNCHKFDKIIPQSYIRFTRAFYLGLAVEDYAKMLADSKIILSPKGFFNTECYRFYEALRQGCIVVTEPLPKTSPFYDNRYYVEVENWDNIRVVIDEILNDPIRMQLMSDEAVVYYNRCLSPKGVAHYVHKTLDVYSNRGLV